MSSQTAQSAGYNEFIEEHEREAACRALLTTYLASIGQEPVDRNAEELFSLNSGVCDRFNYFVPRMPESARRRLLVSGCAAGSEMIIARRFGFQEILGTEVVQDYVQITNQRVVGQLGFCALLYDGRNLPFADNTFTSIVSGHIIEHTPSPYRYLREHIRVLAPGGFMFLEFPDRYNRIELHTGLPSLEYLPEPFRSLGLRWRASRFSSLPPDRRRGYDAIRRTLKPVSVWQISSYLLRTPFRNPRIVHHYSPIPGYTRMLITK
ncbi:MAG TPA: class I SAM-dependent methyltransferase [Blastocatellia bacterium]|nr:class I SAM-dependent methyltransferase [Blastocatellia bacterium]